MNKNFLSFLSEVTVTEVDASAKGGAKKQRNPNPTLLGFRVWADGSIYPSKALVDKFGLEYPDATVSLVKDKEGKDKKVYTVVGSQGFGFDVIDSSKSTQWNSPRPFIAVAVSPKDSPKISLFGLTRYDENGKPLVSVMDQGSATFGKETLLPMLETIYNAKPNEEGFIDVEVFTGTNLKSTNGIEMLPKVISRGADQGKPDYVRRENVDIFAIVPAEIMAEDAATEAVAEDNGLTSLGEAKGVVSEHVDSAEAVELSGAVA